MIQQAITCDICGIEKRQTNHWFLVREESGELRISGWNSLHILLPGTRHLCGETCVHKLISQDLMRLGSGGLESADRAQEDAEKTMSVQPASTAHAPMWHPRTPVSAEYTRLERSHIRAGWRNS